LVPGFDAVKEAARAAGALGCSLSGSGPSVFALCTSLDAAEQVGEAMRAAFAASANIGADLWVSAVGTRGARIVAG
jgi:homoserine kinase